MLPNLRLIIAGCLASFIALMGALAALLPPHQDQRSHVTTARLSPARGPMIDAIAHPEWKPFLVRAAMLRADNLSQLLDLPSQPIVAIQPAALPVPAEDATDQETTASIAEVPAATIPVDIGAASSSELPVIVQPETVPVPAARPARSSASSAVRPAPRRPARKKIVRRSAPSQTASSASTATNPFSSLFGQ